MLYCANNIMKSCRILSCIDYYCKLIYKCIRQYKHVCSNVRVNHCRNSV